jgi:hypothetical protein
MTSSYNNLTILKDFDCYSSHVAKKLPETLTLKQAIIVCLKEGYNTLVREGEGVWWVRPNNITQDMIINKHKAFVNKTNRTNRYRERNIKMFLINYI